MTISKAAATASATSTALRELEGRAWPGGPVVDHYTWRTPAGDPVGPESKSLCIDLDTACTWIHEVEQAVPDRATAAQFLRRLWYSVKLGGVGGLFDKTIRTDRTHELSTAQVHQSTLDGIARAGLLALDNESSSDTIVDLSHVFVLLDLALNGEGPYGIALHAMVTGVGHTSVAAMLSWLGDLGSIWTGFQTHRQRWMQKNPGMTPTRGTPSTPDTEEFWLEQGFEDRCPTSDLLGDFDAVVLAGEVTRSTQSLAELIHGYYIKVKDAPSDAINVANRLRLFLQRSDPTIPTQGAGSQIQLADTALDILTNSIGVSSNILLFAHRWTHRQSIWELLKLRRDVDTEWGKWAVDKIATRFQTFLATALAGQSTSGVWPAQLPEPVNVGYPLVLNGAAASLLVSETPPTTNTTAVDILQALAQYYITSPEPWGPASSPGTLVSPIWLGDLSGISARPGAEGTTSTTIVIDDPVSLRDVWPAGGSALPHRDLIHMEGATATRTSKTFRIESVDPNTKTLSLDADPGLGSAPSAWTIIRRPRLVLVDAFGHRPHLAGTTPVKPPMSSTTLQLEVDAATAAALRNVNLGLDTILLADDEQVPRLPFRILALDLNDPNRPKLSLDRQPLYSLPTRWQIPAGIGGDESPIAESGPLTPGAGADHYDGIMFLIYRGIISQTLPWTSFTSFATRIRSIKGNRRYDAHSFRSPNAPESDFRNYCFMVHEVDERSKPLLEQSDNVPGRDYFANVGTYPFDDGKPLAPTDGPESLIRIHYGNQVPANGQLKTGSAGCLVSPNFFAMRAAIIATYQQELSDLETTSDAALKKVADAATLDASKNLYNQAEVSSAEWDGIIVAELFIIRPDERPLTAASKLTRWQN